MKIICKIEKSYLHCSVTWKAALSYTFIKNKKKRKPQKNEKNYDVFQLENGAGNTAFPEMNNLFSDMIDFYFYEGVWSN